jgi:hypothetical protein
LDFVLNDKHNALSDAYWDSKTVLNGTMRSFRIRPPREDKEETPEDNGPPGDESQDEDQDSSESESEEDEEKEDEVE